MATPLLFTHTLKSSTECKTVETLSRAGCHWTLKEKSTLKHVITAFGMFTFLAAFCPLLYSCYPFE